MTQKMHKIRKQIKVKQDKNGKSIILNGILAGLTAPAIFFTPPVYGSHLHRNGMSSDFRNVGMYLRTAISKSRMGTEIEETKKP